MVIKSIFGLLKGQKQETSEEVSQEPSAVQQAEFEKNVVEPIVNKAKVSEIMQSPQNFVGKEVWIDQCDVMPGMKIVGIFAHSISDGSGVIDGFSGEQVSGSGDIGGVVKLTSKGTPYIEF